MPLRRLLGLTSGASGQPRRSLSTAPSRPPWAMMCGVTLSLSNGPDAPPESRAAFRLADPPSASALDLPFDVLWAHPSRPEHRYGYIYATGGNGFLLLLSVDGIAQATTPVFPNHGNASPTLPGCFVYGTAIAHVVCNPLSSQVLRLPDIGGTSKTSCGLAHAGFLTQADSGDGRPDRYAVAEVSGKDRIIHRFLSETGRWDALPDFSCSLPIPRRMIVDHPVVAFGGRMWWIDLGWGAVSVDTFSDEPDFRFVELPSGSVLPEPDATSTEWRLKRMLGKYRSMGVSDGRLRYTELSWTEPFVLSSFALDDEGRWTLEHRVALSQLWGDGGYPWLPLLDVKPCVGVVDPLNAHVAYPTVGNHVIGIDMERGVVIGSSLVENPSVLMRVMPFVLPPWLESCRIPPSGKSNMKNETLADILVRSDRDRK